MKKKYIFLLVVLVFLGMFTFFLYRDWQHKQEIIEDRQEMFTSKKSIDKKMGYMLYAYSSDSLEQAGKSDDEQIKIAKELHAKYIRVFLETDNKYYKNGKYNLSFIKNALKKIKKANMQPILTFSADRLTEQNEDKNFKKSVKILKKEISQTIVALAKEKIIWESINEANSTVFWFHKDQTKRTTVKSWTKVNDFMKDEVNRFSPDSIYISGAYATAYKKNPLSMLENLEMATKYGMSKDVDALSIHPYNYYSLNGGRPETMFENDVFNKIKSKIGATHNRPLVVSEYGYNSSEGSVGSWQGVFSEEDKANNLVRETLLLDGHGVPLMIIYELEGSGFELASNGKLNIAGKKIKEMIGELKNYTFYRRIPDGNYEDFFYEYRNKKNIKIVYWTSGNEHKLKKFNREITISGTPQYLRIS